MRYLFVFLGGGLGAAARHGVNGLAANYFSGKFPVGTFCINVLGSLLIGVVAEWFALRSRLPMELRFFLITGILGGFTTFSAFSLEIGLLHERGETLTAAIYAVTSVMFAVAFMFAGMYLVRRLAAP